MKRLNTNIGSTKTAFKQTLKVFQSVSVDASLRVALGMVNDFVLIFVAKFVVGFQRIRENIAPFSTCLRTLGSSCLRLARLT